MIQYQVNDGNVEFPQSFTLQEFEELIQNYLTNDVENQDMVAFAVIHFITDFSNDESYLLLEQLTKFINQIEFNFPTSNFLVHKLSLIYGQACLQPIYLKYKDQLSTTMILVNNTAKMIKQLLQEEPHSLQIVKTKQLFMNSDEESQTPVQNNQHADKNQNNFIKYPGLLFQDFNFLFQMINKQLQTFAITEQELVILFILHNENVVQFYNYKEFQFIILQFITCVSFSDQTEREFKLLQNVFDNLENSNAYKTDNIELVQVQTQIIQKILSNNSLALQQKQLQNIQVNKSVDKFLVKHLLKGVPINDYINQLFQYPSLSINSLLSISVSIIRQGKNLQFDQIYSQLKIFDNYQYLQSLNSQIDFQTVNQLLTSLININMYEEIELFVKPLNSEKIIFTENDNLIQLIYLYIYSYNQKQNKQVVEMPMDTIQKLFQLQQISNTQCLALLIFSIQPNYLQFINQKQTDNINIELILQITYSNLEFYKNRIVQDQKQINQLLDQLMKYLQGQQLDDESPEMQQINYLFSSFYKNENQSQEIQLLQLQPFKLNLFKDKQIFIDLINSFDIGNLEHQQCLDFAIQQSTLLDNDQIEQMMNLIVASIINNQDNHQQYIFHLYDIIQNSYNINPLLCSKVNAYLQTLKQSYEQNKFQFYQKPLILNLLQSFNQLQLPATITQLESHLSTMPSNIDLIEDIKQQPCYAKFFSCLLMVILKIDQSVYKSQQKTINKLLKFVFAFPFEQCHQKHYKQLNQILYEALIQQKPGLFIVFSQLQQYINELYNQNTEQQPGYTRKLFLLSLLEVMALQHDNLLMKNQYISSAQLTEYLVKQLQQPIQYIQTQNELMKTLQILLNCSMHNSFSLKSGVMLLLYKSAFTLAYWLLQNQIRNLNTEFSIVIIIFLMSMHINQHTPHVLQGDQYQVQGDESVQVTKSNALSNKIEIKQKQTLIAQQCTNWFLEIQIEQFQTIEQNKIEGLNQFFSEYIEQEQFKDQLIKKKLQEKLNKLNELIDHDDYDEEEEEDQESD